jgi:hypothetical protein
MGTRGVWLAIGGMIGLGCMDPTDGCGCTPTPATALVVGRVQTTAGTTVAGATVSAYIARGGHCTRQESPDGTGDTRSDGSYRVSIASPGETESTCVLVRVRAPLGSGLEDAVDTAVMLTFRYAPPLDSARVNAILRGP